MSIEKLKELKEFREKLYNDLYVNCIYSCILDFRYYKSLLDNTDKKIKIIELGIIVFK